MSTFYTNTASIDNLIVTSSAILSGSVTVYGSLTATASYSTNAKSASYALTASYSANVPLTSSYSLMSLSSSYAATSSYVINAISSSRATTAGSASVATTASYATTVEFPLNNVAGASGLTSFFINQDLNQDPSGNRNITWADLLTDIAGTNLASDGDSINLNTTITGLTSVTSTSFTGSLQGTATTASYVLNAISSSRATTSATASYVLNGVSSSFATTSATASYVLNSVSSSFTSTSATASYVLNSVSSSFASTSATASYVLNAISSSFATNSMTASYYGGAVTSASFATTSATASYVLNAISSSYALTASYAANAGGGGATVTNPGNNYVITSDGTSGGLVGESNLLFDGTNMTITGSIYMTGSLYRPTLVDWEEKYSSPSISGGSLTLDLLQGNVFSVTIDALVSTLSITNPPALNNAGSFVLITTGNGSSYPFVWSNAVTWSGGSAPTLSSGSGKKDIYGFISLNQGTNWYGFIGVQNV